MLICRLPGPTDAELVEELRAENERLKAAIDEIARLADCGRGVNPAG